MPPSSLYPALNFASYIILVHLLIFGVTLECLTTLPPHYVGGYQHPKLSIYSSFIFIYLFIYLN